MSIDTPSLPSEIYANDPTTLLCDDCGLPCTAQSVLSWGITAESHVVCAPCYDAALTPVSTEDVHAALEEVERASVKFPPVSV